MLTPEQLAARRGLITSSVAAAVLGLDDWCSPYDAMLKIKGLYAFDGNAATQRGNLLESACIAFAEECSGLKSKPAPFVRHDNGWSGDSTDALLVDEQGALQGVVEAKTVTRFAMGQWGEEETDDIPLRVLVQAHWHMAHHPSAPCCYVPVLFGGDFVFRMYVVQRNDDYTSHLFEICQAWHKRHIEGDEEVPISGSDADKARLIEKAPRDKLDLLPPTFELDALIDDRLKAAEEVKAAERRLALANNKLREAIGEHEGIASEDYSVTYKKNKDSATTDWRAIALHLGASESVIYSHTAVTPGDRVLRVAKRRAVKPAKDDA